MTVAHSQNGYVANEKSLIATYTVPGTAVRIAMAKGPTSTVLLYVADRYNREVEKLHEGWCWGYASRDIIGSNVISNHASGTAIDLNAPLHPLSTDPASNFSPAQIEACHRIVDSCIIGGVHAIRWGGDYNSRKDGMHWEINAPLVVITALVLRLSTPLPPPPPAHALGEPMFPVSLKSSPAKYVSNGIYRRWIPAQGYFDLLVAQGMSATVLEFDSVAGMNATAGPVAPGTIDAP